MSFDAVWATLPVADIRPVKPSLDVESAPHSVARVADRSLNPQVDRLTASDVGDLAEHSHVTEADFTKVRHAILFTRRNELVQDRDAGSVWAAL
ncbi:MAG: hypothetical protein ABIY40_02785, partial [Rhodanobacteraceae bacterium]